MAEEKATPIIGAPLKSYRDLTTQAVYVAQLACAGAMDPDHALKLVRVLKEAGGMVVSTALMAKAGENPSIGSGAITLEGFAESQLGGMTRPALKNLATVVQAKLDATVDRDFKPQEARAKKGLTKAQSE